MKSNGVHRKTNGAFVNVEGLVVATILSIFGVILLHIGKRVESKTLIAVSFVPFVLAGMAFASNAWMSISHHRRLSKRTAKSQNDKTRGEKS